MASIRELDVERDAAAVVEIIRETSPVAVINASSFAHWERTTPERARARAWVAEADGRVVGRAEAYLKIFFTDTDLGGVQVAVRESHRGRGIGAELYEAASAHALEIGARTVMTNFHETPAGVAFARARGFREVRVENEAALDPRQVIERPSGVLLPISEVDPHEVYEIDMEATRDMPSTEEFDTMPYEEWEQFILEHPLITLEGSFVALADGEAAALSLLTVDHESGRAMSMFTATRGRYRGRGLALAAKLASVHWAAANGVTKMLTFNDATNAPMLAINRRLGYTDAGRRVEYQLSR